MKWPKPLTKRWLLYELLKTNDDDKYNNNEVYVYSVNVCDH